MTQIAALRCSVVLHAFAAVLLVALVATTPIRAAAATPVRAATVPLAVDTASGRHVFRVEIADTPEAEARGLMFRRSLAPEHGMLFVFERTEPVQFWMKNTYVPLDIIFIRPDGSVLRIAADARPLSTALIPSGGPVRYVLELRAGTASRIGLVPGNRVELPAGAR